MVFILHISPLQAPICWLAWAPANVCIWIGTPRRCAVCPAGEATSLRAWAGTSCWAMRPARGPYWLGPVKASSLRLKSLEVKAACLTQIQISISDRSVSVFDFPTIATLKYLILFHKNFFLDQHIQCFAKLAKPCSCPEVGPLPGRGWETSTSLLPGGGA